jgi:hypothetical protein
MSEGLGAEHSGPAARRVALGEPAPDSGCVDWASTTNLLLAPGGPAFFDPFPVSYLRVLAPVLHEPAVGIKQFGATVAPNTPLRLRRLRGCDDCSWENDKEYGTVFFH